MYTLAKHIESKKEFDEFLKLFMKDCNENCSNWENNTIERFIEALCAYNQDRGNVNLSWSFFADLLLAAKVYE
jgi:hypothetical protein